jgi:mono/diheme cytochrome c family protein
MHEGRFLHSQVETPYGPERCNDGGVWRFDPNTWRLERHVQSDFSNPWGQAVDQWGQNFTCDASPGQNWWSLPLSLKMPYGEEVAQHGEFTTHKVRPTSGAEFVYSSHFPDDVQGDFLICNSIGFLGTKQHKVVDDGSGFTGELRFNLIQSSDPNFRPVDLEFAADGSLYIVDWHNPLIGHMQHSARDPNRDQDHGRIYRLTYPERPLVTPAKVDGESVAALLDHLKRHEFRTRVRARRELQEHPADHVVPAVKAWARKLDKNDPNYDRHLLEALWATWAQNAIDPGLLQQVLNAKTPEARAAAVRVARYGYDLPNRAQILMKAANDPNPRVRLEAAVAATWLENEAGARVVLEAIKHPYDDWMAIPYETALKNYKPIIDKINKKDLANNENAKKWIAGAFKFERKNAPEVFKHDDILKAKGFNKVEFGLFNQGAVIYKRDAHCATCHQENGEGLPNLYPPIANSDWLQGEKERLIKITLKGLWGELTVKGHTFNPATTPPMTGFGGLLTDTEIAAVLTYARNSFGNDATAVYPEEVAKIREQIKDRQVFYMVEDILKENPFKEGELEANANKKPGKGKK